MAKPWYNGALTYIYEQQPHCCGINVVGGFVFDGEFDVSGRLKNELTQRAVSSEVRRMTKELNKKQSHTYYWLRPATTWLLTIIDKDEDDFKLWKVALKRAGWKCINKSKTAHSDENYNIYLYSINFKRKKK